MELTSFLFLFFFPLSGVLVPWFFFFFLFLSARTPTAEEGEKGCVGLSHAFFFSFS